MPCRIHIAPQAKKAVSELRGPVRDRYHDKLKEIKKQGCRACGYKLTGFEPPGQTAHWICCVHLNYDYRLITGHGDDHDVVVLYVGRHSYGDRGDVYRALGELFELEIDEDAPRTKPPCCGRPSEIDVEDPADIDVVIDRFGVIIDRELPEIAKENDGADKLKHQLKRSVEEFERRSRQAHERW